MAGGSGGRSAWRIGGIGIRLVAACSSRSAGLRGDPSGPWARLRGWPSTALSPRSESGVLEP